MIGGLCTLLYNHVFHVRAKHIRGSKHLPVNFTGTVMTEDIFLKCYTVQDFHEHCIKLNIFV